MSTLGLKIVKRHEGYREFAYPDPASPLAMALRRAGIRIRWGFSPIANLMSQVPPELAGLSPAPLTCGYGETKGITASTRWSEQEATVRLKVRYVEFENGVLNACTIPPNENELAAMTCLAYNIGLGAFRKSTVLRAHNRGDSQAASRAFNLFNKAGGKVFDGLVRRRAEEGALYLKPVAVTAEQPTLVLEVIPQVVDAESKISESPINRAGAVAGGTAAVATVAETARTISDVKDSAASLGDWLIPIMLLLIVGLCGYLVWQRFQQRKGGWA
jgi:lysozyme